MRRVEGDPEHDWEVICGARRHWTVSWMRAHHQPDFRFLVEPRELTDEEAFRLADLENRSRRDLSDYERARDYARAVERYYGGSQQQMAERLEVSRSWLSRYLELARLPAEIVAAFASPHAIGISHAAILAPLLRADDQRDRIVAEARRLAAEQAELGRARRASAVTGGRHAAADQRGTRPDRDATGRRPRVSMSSGHPKAASSRAGKAGAGEGG